MAYPASFVRLREFHSTAVWSSDAVNSRSSTGENTVQVTFTVHNNCFAGQARVKRDDRATTQELWCTVLDSQ